MDILFFTSEWIIGLSFFVLLIVSIEIGYVFGRRGTQEANDGTSGTFLGVMGSVLGLLALLLAFSFSMAATRYDQRKQLLVKEANAIGTSYLRTNLLTAPAETQLQDLLREYVDARLAQHDAGIDPDKVKQTAAVTEQLQTKLWNLAAAEARKDSHSLSAAQVVQSVNDVIDVSAEQAAAYRNHVPEVILWMLLATALASGALVGCAFGRSRERHLTATIVFAAMTTVVVLALFDLDRPRRGLMRVSQQAMTDLRTTMQPVR
jgi:nucleotidyltransferase/DNA polymerase involved in DNA repair